ncbi:MAG TPA: lactonase family protein [Tepidisphaeraceae bacterium]|nr:lactonase family protein [Tepidisphaeraceae bacterium]
MTNLPCLFVAVATLVFAGLSGCASDAPPHAGNKPASVRVYLGTYTSGTSKGVYMCNLDLASGALSEPRLAGEAQNPSFLAISPDRRFMYTADEFGKFAGGSAISAFAIENDGTLKHLNDQPLTGGPCYVSTDKTGHVIFAADYGNGTVASFTAGPDGALSEPVLIDQHRGVAFDPKRQAGPHAHCIDADAANKFVLSCDLGLDKVFVYRLDARTGQLTANDPPSASVNPGSGPRHLAFHPNGKLVYVIDELASTITAFSYDAQHGTLHQIETMLTLPAGFTGQSSCAEIAIHPNGKFLYGSNRGHDSIAIFAIDTQTGKLTSKGHVSTQGKNPRSFGIDPSGTWLIAANQNSDNLVVFRIDPNTGALSPAGKTISLGAPVCVKFMEAGH